MSGNLIKDALPNMRGQEGKVWIIPVSILLLLVFFNSYVIVEAGHIGVIKTLGAIRQLALPEGFHLKKPFMDVVEQMDLRLTSAQVVAASASRDLQTVQTQVTVQFSLNGDFAPLTFQKVGQRSVVANTVVGPAIQESVKAITAQYTAEQLVTQRAEVKLKIQEAIEDFIDVTLKEKGLGLALLIANVAITDFQFSDEFNRAIELKVKAEQEALQAKNEKIRRITQAEAANAEKKLGAEAEAFQIEAGSKARADAITREAAALKNNPQLIQLRTVEKWDGVLPRVNGGNTVPILNLEGVLSGK